MAWFPDYLPTKTDTTVKESTEKSLKENLKFVGVKLNDLQIEFLANQIFWEIKSYIKEE